MDSPSQYSVHCTLYCTVHRAHVLSLLNRGVFFIETCLFSCFTYYYGREDLIPEELELGNFRMEIKAFFYKHIHRIHSKPLEINLFLFLGLKHPCMDWEHGLSNTYRLRSAPGSLCCELHRIRTRLGSNFECGKVWSSTGT